jgi:uncharacterized membrane protein
MLFVVGLRIAIGAIVLAIVGVAAAPLLVLRDLSNGGTGWGLCAEGVGACENSYFSGFELVGGLVLVLFALLGLLAVFLRTLRIVQKRQAMRDAGVPMGLRETGSLRAR